MSNLSHISGKASQREFRFHAFKSLSAFAVILLLTVSHPSFAQNKGKQATISGRVEATKTHSYLPYATVQIKGTTIGIATDEAGHYQLVVPREGKWTLQASYLGFKTAEKEVTVKSGESITVNFELVNDYFGMDEVVVSANRGEQKRSEAPVIVNTISPKLFKTIQSPTLSEGLNFTPGLRLENNCQNCGFSQVRMNGLEGPYSQILINSRPVFSGLAGVYGLELIPSNMIERIEVVRGGGSALYGGNAIAGTINILMKDPISNCYEAGVSYAMTGVGVKGSAGPAADYGVNFNTSLVSSTYESGISMFGYSRKREMFDANNDSFSELSPIKNLTLGGRAFHRFSSKDKLTLDFFAIQEKRDGGNKQDMPLHERDVAEALQHDMKVAGLTYERFFRTNDLLSVYASGQFLNRDSYYGAGQSLKDYGNSVDNSYNAGVQYKFAFKHSSLNLGVENTGDYLKDKKLGYPDIENAQINFADSTISIPHPESTVVSDQSLTTTGAFAQYDLHLNRFRASAGVRYDHYSVKDRVSNNNDKNDDVFSPRVSLMYDFFTFLQGRVSYSQGYRAPQVFDEDLHIETSGARKVIHKNDPNLKQETSHSMMLSLDFNKRLGKVNTSFLVEGFYTQLNDAFRNEFGEPDENGTVIYTRVNAPDGAVVKGVNMELKVKPAFDVSFLAGFTIQSSKFEKPQDFDERRFFRTPDQYGFFTLDWDVVDNLCLSATGNYIGSMLVPYFGPKTNKPQGELRVSPNFFDAGAKISYKLKLKDMNAEISAGVKNIFNSYQKDFDISADRDPSYIYGPVTPRTVMFSFKIGNI